MNRIEYNTLNETLYHQVLKNGLNVYVLPKKGFNKTYVTLTTPLGSNVNRFQEGDKVYQIPNGIAHFLEHKLFDRDGKDLSEEFSLHSARVNAFTSNTRTTYLFSATDHIKENIHTLMDMVFHPEFTEEGIQKEVGIITQEIKMYEDDPNALIYTGILRNMYENHPVKEDILGSVTSINQITKETLEAVHKTFYSPSEMIMFITGNVNEKEIIEFLETVPVNHEGTNGYELLDNYNENMCVKTKSKSIEKDILQPNALLGIKLPIFNHKHNNYLKQELSFSILFDLVFGKSSDNYLKLLNKGLVNETFGTDITLESNYSYIMIGSNTDHPEELYKEIKEMIHNACYKGVDTSKFDRVKKQLVGSFINALNSIEYIANQFTKYHYHNVSLFDLLEIAKDITIEDVKRCKQFLLNPDCYTEFTIYPKEKDITE